MNILFIGDIFGKTGRKMIATYLPKIVEKYSVECVIANGENTSHGKGYYRNIMMNYLLMVFL